MCMYSQQQNISDSISMKKFDVERFEKNKTDYFYRYQEKEYIISQFKTAKSYVEKIENTNNPYTEYTSYYLDTHTVKVRGSRFYDSLTGVGRVYGKQGEILEEVNYDLPYKFSFEELAEKMKREYNLDIMVKNPHILMVSRSTDPYPYYQINLVNTEIRTIIVHGETGDTISETNYKGEVKEITPAPPIRLY